MTAERADSRPLRGGRPELGPGGVGALVPVVLASLAGAAGTLLIAESIARQLASFAAGGDPAEWLALGALGVLLRAGAAWAQSVLARRAAIRAKSALRRDLAARIARGDAAGGGTAVLATEGLDALDDYFGVAIPAMVSALVVPFAAGLRILGADLLSTIVLVCTIPLVPVFMALIGMHTRDRVDRSTDALTRLADHLVELARGLPVLVGLGRLEEQLAALDRIQSDYRSRTMLTLRTAFLSALALELIATISVAVVAVFLGVRLISGDVTLEVAVLVLLLAPECFTALREVGTAFHSSQDGLSALRRVRELLADGRVSAVPADGAPALEHVGVRFPGRDAVFAGLTVRPVVGRITALAGRSGCGKSTALAALVGALPADAVLTGTVTGDPAHTAYAAQTPRFAEETLLEELALAGADADAARALAAELGLEGVLGAPLAELSPGEQRRAALARALARVDAGATLLVLDEPTAHLDDASAERVRAAVRARADRVATVLVAHEPATLAIADEVVTLGGQAWAGFDTRPAPPVATQPAVNAATAHDVVNAGDGRLAARPAVNAGGRGAPPEATRLETAGPAAGRGPLRTVLAASPWRWVGASVMAALAIGLGLALTGVSGWLIVRASEGPAIMYLLVAIVGVRFFGLGRPVARYVERLLAHDAVFRATDVLRLRLWRRLAAQGPAMRGLLGGGATLDVLVTEPAELRDQLPRVIPPIAAGVVAVAGVGVTTSIVAPELTGVVWTVLAVTVALAAGAGVLTARAAASARVAARAALVRRITGLAQAADELRGGGLAPAARASIDRLGDELAAAERRTAAAAGLGSAVALAGCAGLAVAVPVLAPAALPASTVAVVAMLALALVEAVDGVAAAARRIPTLRAVLGRLAPLLEAPETIGGDRRLDAPVSRVELDQVARTLPGRELFAGITASVGAGERLRIEGPSGSGKSTLLAMIMGSLAPDAGAVRADGAPVADLDSVDWGRHIAWCPQEAHVFDSTIRGNLLIGRGRDDAPDDAELVAAIERAGLGGLYASLPDGLTTRVGQAGRALSGGERQRLAIARALLARSEVLLLDEPTAHLDEPTARALMRDIRDATSDRIVVLVSHRADDADDADRVVRLGGFPHPALV
ncbi:thiol reductant ABC exporter subunit CydC [Protaetiibacter sp. SSC-01]|uniref:thiol reductant ABC exporter subunit CydC n=1 Tax=Protaetiibacter sp. SSC-01 TaxID=2759943 RepID=UPI001657444C|nr:thiol reductant ABC exporter subunit CydC [Protaetiibacter sp. SSC-01]QNO38353.1 thiol reductant ABC exporter subunit CydC [Protaetiibacter sp. SSC-01]